MEKEIFDLEWEEAQKLMLIDLPITIQKIIKKAYPTIYNNGLMINELEERIKKIAIAEVEIAIAACKKL